MLRLALNATSLLPPVTGIGRYTYNLAKNIEKIGGAEIYYYYPGHWSCTRELRLEKSSHGWVYLKKAIKSVVPKPHLVSRYMQQKAFNYGISKYKPDIYHEPNYIPYDFTGPTVITIHDLSHIRHPETHPIDRLKLFDRLIPKAIEQSEKIIAVSEFTKKEIIDVYGVDKDKVHVTLEGVEDAFYAFDSSLALEILNRMGLEYRSFLLVVGTLEPRKNLSRVIDAYTTLEARLQEKYPLVITGMKGWNISDFEKKIASLINCGKIRLTGYVSDHTLKALYSGAKIFLYPSLYEGFGLPPLEAMASRTPVIASERSAMPEIIKDAGILVNPENVIAISDAIKQLLCDEEEVTRLTRLGYIRSKEFSWDKCAKNTLEVYSKIL